jgi:formylglycine-generating enzyme required for sulfatase activity
MSHQKCLRLIVFYGLFSLIILEAPGWTTAPAPGLVATPKMITNLIGMKLARIPPGKFKMGSPDTEQGHVKPVEDQREVEIRTEFWMGIHEVTQKQFKEVVGYNPSYFSRAGKGKPQTAYVSNCQPAGGKAKVPADTSNFPVENVTWTEAVEFCKKLTAQSGERGRKYRLPTGAEWEYACRGGSSSYRVFHFGDSLSSRQANFNGEDPFFGAAKGDSVARTCKVGSYEKNAVGLFDMHGNVFEWCADYKDPGNKLNDDDVSIPLDSGPIRFYRGGSWGKNSWCCRSAYRGSALLACRNSEIGFRVVLARSGK